MKRKSYLVMILMNILVIVTFANGQKNDTLAQKIVEENLSLIDGYLKDNTSDPSLKRASAIAFLTKLTGIPSSSPGNYVGQYSPTERDLALWKNWYVNNKNNITWDRKKKCIIFCKTVKPPKFE